jgi:hypothetical protein
LRGMCSCGGLIQALELVRGFTKAIQESMKWCNGSDSGPRSLTTA